MKRIFPVAACATLSFALLATACSSDAPEVIEEQQQAQQQEGNTCLTLHIQTIGNGLSRAAVTTEQEQTIDDVCIMIYNANGDLMRCRQVPASQLTHVGDGVYEYKLLVDAGNGDPAKLPTQLLAVANMESAQSVFSGLSYDSAFRLVNELGTYRNANGNFIMTSSTYVEGNTVKCGAPIHTDAIYSDSENAATAVNVNIYLERLVAKVIVDKAAEIPVSTPGYTDGSLKFELLGMALNATNPTTYYMKQLQPDYQLAWAWNDVAQHRSYWATDANYSGIQGYNSAFRYLTYNEVVGNKEDVEYCFENTSDNAELDIQTTTHLLLVGKYTLEGVPANTDLYRWLGKLWTLEDFLSVVRNRNPYYIKNADGSFELIPVTCYELNRVGAIGNQSAEVSVQLSGISQTLYADYGGNYVEIPLAEANQQLASLQHGIKYGKGCCYYALPIRHLAKEGVGQYAVVRNHCYRITITDIRSLGRGIYDPGSDPGNPGGGTDGPGGGTDGPGGGTDGPGGGTDGPGGGTDGPGGGTDGPGSGGDDPGEPIVPEPQDSDPDYYIGSKMEVLDWYAVDQDVDCL